MKIDPNESAFPGQRLDSSGMPCSEFAPGLTIRAHFALELAKGSMACDDQIVDPAAFTRKMILLADIFIEELNK